MTPSLVAATVPGRYAAPPTSSNLSNATVVLDSYGYGFREDRAPYAQADRRHIDAVPVWPNVPHLVVAGQQLERNRIWTPRFDPLPAPDGKTRCADAPDDTLRPAGVEPVPLCLMQGHAITQAIRANGTWPDCDELVALYQQAEVDGGGGRAAAERAAIVQIGSGLGVCTVAMLRATDVPMVHVFEPNPEARFFLSNSIWRLAQRDAGVRARARIYPVLAGATSLNGSQKVYYERGNVGTVIDRPAVSPCAAAAGAAAAAVGEPRPSNADDEACAESFELSSFDVDTVRLDDVLATPGDALHRPEGRYPLLTMAMDGGECAALKGAAAVLHKVRFVRAEVTAAQLEAQGCSEQGLIDQLQEAGFTVVRNDFHFVGAVHDIVARRETASLPTALDVATSDARERRHSELGAGVLAAE